MTPTEAIEVLEHILVGAPDDRANEALQWAIEQLRAMQSPCPDCGEPQVGYMCLKLARVLATLH